MHVEPIENKWFSIELEWEWNSRMLRVYWEAKHLHDGSYKLSSITSMNRNPIYSKNNSIYLKNKIIKNIIKIHFNSHVKVVWV